MKPFLLSALFALMCSAFPINEARADDEIDCRVALVDCEANPNSKCCGGAQQNKGNPACVKKDGSFAVIGESYKVDCNTCKCTKSGPNSCTKMACHNIPDEEEEPSITVCRKEDGSIAKVGEKYKRKGGKCVCTDSGPECKASQSRGRQ